MPEASIALVTPRYGDRVIGGSESVMREAAAGLAARGFDVEVLTTCAWSHYTWANDLPPGPSRDGAVRVRRFPVEHPRSLKRWARLDVRMSEGERLTAQEELAWASGRLRVPGLYRHLLASTYDAVVFSPYLAWTTYACAPVVAERAIVMPCFHDEQAARLRLFSGLLGGTAAAWFLSEPERDLADSIGPLGPRPTVTGAGVDVPDRYQPERFRARYGVHGRFALYAGRRELLKGWDRLADTFLAARAHLGLDLDLVTFGANELRQDLRRAPGIVDLGALPAEDVADAFSAAEVYVQPSRNESFSRTVMEAWLAGTPVLADGGGAVVAWHVRRSQAGLLYRDDHELARALQLFGAQPEAGRRLAAPGRAYVLDSYRWDVVLDRMAASLLEVARVPAGTPA